MRQLTAFVFILLLSVLPSCKFLREKGIIGKKASALAALQAKQDSIRVADSIRNVQDRLLAIENARLDSVMKIDRDRLEWESRYRYNIIVGSFITPEYARLFSADMSQKGYNSRIIKLEGTKFEMVSAESHDNFRKAVNRLKQFQDTVALDAWMYIYKKN
ncbi:MAG: hypothetical protein C0408_00420 [Odoribacter sp.]|nr:hypothetical protein [Odoribacter sp.]